MIKSNVLFDNVWAISQGELSEVVQIYNFYQYGKDFSPEGLKTELFPGKPIFTEKIKNTLIIRIDGKIAFYQDPFLTMISTTSIFKVLEILLTALKDESVKKIVLEINSPGGILPAALMLSQIIYSLRELKPIYGLVNNECLSGAYLIGSACTKLYVASQAVMVGSIGVVTSISAKPLEVEERYKVLVVAAGKFKTVDSPRVEETEEFKKYKEATMMTAYDIFVEAVCKYRGLTQEVVKNTQGMIFYADESIGLDLIDGYYDLKEWILNKEVRRLK